MNWEAFIIAVQRGEGGSVDTELTKEDCTGEIGLVGCGGGDSGVACGQH